MIYGFPCSLVVDFENEDEYDPEQFVGNQVPILIVGTKIVSCKYIICICSIEHAVYIVLNVIVSLSRTNLGHQG